MQTPQLHSAQRRAVTRFSERGGRGIAWHKVGEGKTRIALTTFATLQFETPCILVVITRRKAFRTWIDEVHDCGFLWGYIFSGVIGAATGSPTLWLVSEAMLHKEVDSIINNPYVRMVVIDELYLFKNPASKKNRAASRLAARYPTIGLSGSIMTAGRLDDVYGQCRAVGIHREIAPTLTAFRDEYQMSFNDYGFPTWCAKRGAYKQIMSKLQPFIDIHMPTADSREIHKSVIKIDPTDEQRKLVRELRDVFEAEEYGVETDSAAGIVIKIQQVSNGWLKANDGTIHEFPSPKVERLQILLEELLDAGERAVVWCAFQHDVEMLSRLLPFATLQMSGAHKFNSKAWQDGKAKVVLATEGSGSSINDFAQVKYAIYFSQTFKWLDLQQSMGRTNRKSSQHQSCYYYFLHTIGTLDEHVFRTVKTSEGLEAALFSKGEVLQWLKT